MMEAAESRDIFLSCFKCGRIVRSSDSECPRCGLQFGPGTLFECPFCSGLIWRNASRCTSCGIDLTEFSESVMRTSSGFDMDSFVDGIINNELEQLKSTIRRVACPGCGLMIRGDEDRCPRCDLPLEEAKVDCPVCGEKISISAKSCISCQAVFEELPDELEATPAVGPAEAGPEAQDAVELRAEAPEVEVHEDAMEQVVEAPRQVGVRSKPARKSVAKKPLPKKPARAKHATRAPARKVPSKKTPPKKGARPSKKKAVGKPKKRRR